MCKEGHDSFYVHIVSKGEFEVSKVIDMSKLDDLPKSPRKVNQ